MTHAWPARLARREGLANARSAGWLATLLTVAVAWISTVAGTASALDASRLRDAEQAWIDAGGYTYVIEAAGEDSRPLSASACEALNVVTGVNGAFATTLSNVTMRPASAPGNETTMMSVSPGIYRFLSLPAPRTAGVVTTPKTTGVTGLRDGEQATFVLTDFADGAVAGRVEATLTVTDSAKLGDDLTGAYLLVSLTDGDAKQCYVTTDAAHAEAVRTYLGAALSADDGSAPVVRPRISANTYGLDFETAYSRGLLRWAWAAGAAALFAMWAVTRWTRRTHTAVYATFGAHARARLIMQVTEWCALSAVGASWGWATGVTLAIGLGATPVIALTQVTLQIVALWFAATIGVIALGVAPVGTLLDALKDRA